MLNSVQDPLDFEDLTAIYRVEKKAPTLSAVRKDLYPAIAGLLMALNTEYSKQLSMDPDSLICEGANQRRKKAKQLSKEIVELRMQKICSLALRGAMGAQNMIEQLTVEEKEYYNSILETSRRQGSIISRMTGDKKYDTLRIDPIVEIKKVPLPPEPAKVLTPPPIESKSDEEVHYEPEPETEEPFFDEFPDEDQEPNENLMAQEDGIFTPIRNLKKEDSVISVDIPPVPENVESIKEEENLVLVRITEDLPEFSGPDRDYKLSKEDVIMMPKVMANVLIHREKAILLTPSA
jgi:DNA replication factor GINS